LELPLHTAGDGRSFENSAESSHEAFDFEILLDLLVEGIKGKLEEASGGLALLEVLNCFRGPAVKTN